MLSNNICMQGICYGTTPAATVLFRGQIAPTLPRHPALQHGCLQRSTRYGDHFHLIQAPEPHRAFELDVILGVHARVWQVLRQLHVVPCALTPVALLECSVANVQPDSGMGQLR